ncbi:hypothetical protein NL676_003188 [Syzygium grande]|nr:hypothetical protein NL676_003188 [Syzygium grande]
MLARIELAILLYHLSVGYKSELLIPDASFVYLPHPTPADKVERTLTDHSSPERKLKGKVAIITGGVSGIGEEAARQFAHHRAYVVIADVQDETGQSLVESIGLEHRMYVCCDITDEEQVKSLVESTVHARGHLDIIFSNADVMSSSKQDVLDFDMNGYERLFAVNVGGIAASVKHGARAMVAGSGGRSIL